ncbi:MAG: LysM peptidoglycan-binding domain-containing protein [Micrococcales bacterium]|nr:LysM peptidoglycan-binding domain-containing protein [Micrococcales bacterium]
MNSGPSNQKSPKVHIYLLGESLADLALQYQLSLAELLEANQLTLQSILYPGQKLIIPETVQEQTSAPLPQEHIVALGESLISIATKYGLTVESLRAMNDLGENAMLYPGTYLSLQAKTNQPEFDSNQAPKHCLVHGYHRVKPGDQLNRIAAFHGISTQALLTANNLSWNSVVAAGSKLVIPISHDVLTCPNLVALSETSMSIAKDLVAKASENGVTEYGSVIALCLEMQRSGLQPELGNKSLRDELIDRLAKLNNQYQSVLETLEQIGFENFAEGASLWEPSAWAWIHQIRSNSE